MPGEELRGGPLAGTSDESQGSTACGRDLAALWAVLRAVLPVQPCCVVSSGTGGDKGLVRACEAMMQEQTLSTSHDIATLSLVQSLTVT